MQDIIIEEEHSKVIGIGLLGILMTVITVIELVVGIMNAKLSLIIIGIIGSLFFGFCTIYLYSRVCRSKPLLTVSTEGIYDSSSASAIGFIPYKEIAGFEIINIFGQKMIGIQLVNEEQFIQSITPMKQKAARANLKMNMPPIALRVDTAKDMSIEDIFSLLEKRWNDNRSLFF